MLMKTKLSPDYGGGHMDRNQDIPVILHHLLEPDILMKRRLGKEKAEVGIYEGNRKSPLYNSHFGWKITILTSAVRGSG